MALACAATDALKRCFPSWRRYDEVPPLNPGVPSFHGCAEVSFGIGCPLRAKLFRGAILILVQFASVVCEQWRTLNQNSGGAKKKFGTPNEMIRIHWNL
jgi:hypothetical protein